MSTMKKQLSRFGSPGFILGMILLLVLSLHEGVRADVSSSERVKKIPLSEVVPQHMVKALEMMPDTEGRVASYLLSPHGEVEGLLLADGTQVRFPPHMGEDLVRLVKPGEYVKVEGRPSYEAPVVHAWAIANTDTGERLVEEPPHERGRRLPPHLRGEAQRPMSADGTVNTLLYGKWGEVHGVVLKDGTQVRFPRHVIYRTARFIEEGAPLAVEGYGVETPYGRVIEADRLGRSYDDLVPVHEPRGPRHRH